MTSLFSLLKDSIFSLTSTSQRIRALEDEDVELTELLRARMLDAVTCEDGEDAFRLARRIRCTGTLQSLWFMRSELVAFTWLARWRGCRG
jgi:hypothetical protein